MKHVDWDKVLPDVPIQFHQAVLDALDKVETPKRASKRKIFLLAIAAILLLSTASLGVRKVFGVLDILEKQGIPVDEGIQELAQVPELIGIEETLPKRGDMPKEITDTWLRLPTQDALIQLTELVYDGKNLHVLFTNSEAGKGFSFTADALFVNGVDHGWESGGEWLDAEKNPWYYAETDISDLSLEGDFDLTLPLSVYKDGRRYWSQYLTYRVRKPVASYGQSLIPPEKLRLVNHDVIFHTIHRGVTTTDLSFSYRFSQWKDKPARDLSALADTYYDLVAHDAYTLDGKAVTMGDMQMSKEQIQDTWVITYNFSLLDLPKDQDAVRIVPSRYKETPDAQWALDEVLTDEAFTIDLPPAV